MIARAKVLKREPLARGDVVFVSWCKVDFWVWAVDSGEVLLLPVCTSFFGHQWLRRVRYSECRRVSDFMFVAPVLHS